MAYIKTTWINNVTKANATNLNKIEDELEALDTDVTQAKTDIEELDQSVGTLTTDLSEFTNLIKYDLIVSEAPIKTGRKIDGKDEYVARVNLGSLPNASSKDVKLPFNASEITLIRIDATAYNSATNVWMPIPLPIDLVNNVLRISTSTNRSSFTGKADIYFTYRSGKPYKRLEYIESTGTQRIDTGITPDNTTEFEMKYNQTAINGQFDTIIGGQASNTGIFVMPTFNSTVYQKSLRYNTTENKTSTTNSYYQVDTTLTLKQNVFTFDNGTNQESITTGSYSSFSAAQPLWLFALNDGGTTFGLAKMKLYYCKIWKNNELVRDLIPIRMIESGNVGLWDKVNREFLSNTGTGVFTAGAELPDEDVADS